MLNNWGSTSGFESRWRLSDFPAVIMQHSASKIIKWMVGVNAGSFRTTLHWQAEEIYCWVGHFMAFQSRKVLPLCRLSYSSERDHSELPMLWSELHTSLLRGNETRGTKTSALNEKKGSARRIRWVLMDDERSTWLRCAEENSWKHKTRQCAGKETVKCCISIQRLAILKLTKLQWLFANIDVLNTLHLNFKH
jgi:hypothetical protein